MSVFSDIDPSSWIASNELAFAVNDGFPVSDGHALIVPKRRIVQWWDATEAERLAIFDLVDIVKRQLDRKYTPAGYNVGFNSGEAAGQTVMHFHLHVIPRYTGDVADPIGGVRHVIPVKANYLSTAGHPELTGISDELPDRIPIATVSPGVPFTAMSGDTLASRGSQRLIDPLGPRRLRHELLDCLNSPELDRIDLLVSFIMKSGLALIWARLEEALQRGARVRLLTTDYLHITDADALAHLLDLAESHATGPGDLAVRVFSDPLTPFHPKAYLFYSSIGVSGAGFIGSSNLSRSGIDGGIEWSLGVAEVGALVESFDTLWRDPRSRTLNHSRLRDYRSRWLPSGDRPQPHRPEEAAVEVEPPMEPVSPRPIQVEGLEALNRTRTDGHRSGLVVMATGLGKTWLAAFDSVRSASGSGKLSAPAGKSGGRILFIAHRDEILTQSRDVYRQVAPDLELGLYNGDQKQSDADVVFASIQTLSRRLGEFDDDEFDYVVVDEFHHAAASSYLRTIDHFSPRFLLGLTATPDRLDGADLLALCGDNLIFECGLVEGIDRSELTPFHYWGIKDVVDYAPIPWRNGKFDPDQLTQAVETQARAEHTLDQWRQHCGDRTLAFCVSITHADFMADFFTANRINAVAVHSGPTSSSRADAVSALSAGDLEIIFTVDVFNEGVDIPEIASVMMLRPTASPVIFLQQLGRGLRTSEGKSHLTVVDFVGNHSSFLLKPRILFSLASTELLTQRQAVRTAARGDFELPAGCSVNFDLESINLFQKLVDTGRVTKVSALEEYCIDTTDETGNRPSAVQAFAAGLDPSDGATKHESWFGLLSALELLDSDEQLVVDAHGPLLRAFETESITKSYKLVTLRALIADGTLRSGTTVQAICERSLRLVLGDPRLVLDVRQKAIPEPSEVSASRWEGFWRKNPLTHLGKPTTGGSALFTLDGDSFVPNFAVDESIGDVFDRMIAEIVQWRLAAYLLGTGSAATGESGEADGSTRAGGENSGSEPQARLDQPGHDESHLIGERFRRDQAPEMFGVAYNPGNWQSGHISLGEDAVLFVTLHKSSAMQYGSDYVDHFNSPSEFVWASQNSVGPASKKGREVLGSPSNGVRLHLFVRAKKSDVAFEYCGLIAPVSHHGEKPMSVTFRLRTPLRSDAAKRFGVNAL